MLSIMGEYLAFLCMSCVMFRMLMGERLLPSNKSLQNINNSKACRVQTITSLYFVRPIFWGKVWFPLGSVNEILECD